MDAVGNSITFQRDYAGKVKSIANTLGKKFPIVLTPMGLFQAIEVPSGEIIVDYHDTEGLLKSIWSLIFFLSNNYLNCHFQNQRQTLNGQSVRARAHRVV